MSNPVAIGAGRFLPSDIQIESEASRMAALCRRAGYRSALDLAERSNVKTPRGESCFTQKKRLDCARWWCKQLRRVNWRESEARARESGKVQKGNQLYCSDHSVARFRLRRANAREFMSGQMALNLETGAIVNLGEAAEHNLSNTSVRRAELLARIRGLEEYAKAMNYRCEFWTLTAPSRFHSRHVDGRKNTKHNGETPADGRDWLQRTWARVRAALNDVGLQYLGLRIAEPHHDGTPHFHILMMMDRAGAGIAGEIMAKIAMQDTPPINQEIRFKAVILSANKSAVGYVVKYVCKAIDGHGVGHSKVLDGETGEQVILPVDAAEAAERVVAWASLWGIRQFQFFGGFKIGAWRELRRVDAIKGEVPELLQTLHENARAGDYSSFVAEPAANHLAVTFGATIRGEYGDQITPVSGLDYLGFDFDTRGAWEIVPLWVLEKGGFIPSVGTTAAQGIKLVDYQVNREVKIWSPRTRLNNCREQQNHVRETAPIAPSSG